LTDAEVQQLSEGIRGTLATLKDVAGVAGSFVCTDSGHLLARELPAVFDDRVLGEGGAQRGDHRVLGLRIGVEDDVRVVLGVHGPALEIAPGVDEHRGGAARRVDRNGQDRIVLHRVASKRERSAYWGANQRAFPIVARLH